MASLPETTHDLAGSLLGLIQSRTHGRLRDLSVEVDEAVVVLRGQAPDFYTKQLALHGALDTVIDKRIVDEIRVVFQGPGNEPGAGEIS